MNRKHEVATTITISRQLGSLGCEVAHALAERLAYRVVWRDLINQAALRAGAPEVALATIDELGLLGLRPSSDARQAYHDAVRQVMEELADAGGVVIVGRAGQAILRQRVDVFHVRVVAPRPLRAERLAQAHQVSQSAALTQVEASDRRRKSYLRRYYQTSWDDPAGYHLVINTGRLTPEQGAEAIAHVLSRLPSTKSTPSNVETKVE